MKRLVSNVLENTYYVYGGYMWLQTFHAAIIISELKIEDRSNVGYQ